MTHPVVFVGFSMTDPDFANLMREVTARLRSSPPAHYALLGYSTIEEREAYALRMTDKFGVRPVFYSLKVAPGEDRYANLMLLLDALAEKDRPVRKLATVEPPASAPGPVDPNDPNKRQFGEQAERNGRRLTARPLKQAGDWVRFELVVKATDERPIRGRVEFHLHPTFDEPVVRVTADNGSASFVGMSYGAFTVGVALDGGETRLELDLAFHPDFPVGWRQR
ncbi:hypothetical protein GVN21_10350 [Caulobacter sp. SLTY]|nr:hypothetical protein [Caulobacter sp. SLTY]